jgi:phage shock protein C
LPKPTADKKDFEVNRFLVNREQGKIMGVAAGLADYSGVDVLIIRLALVAGLVFISPLVLLFYVLTGWLAGSR